MTKNKIITFDFGDGRGPVPAHQHINPDGSVGGWVADCVEIEAGAKILMAGEVRFSGYLKTNIRGGTFEGGTFEGGTFEGGAFWGGEFWGGTFRGGTFRGGTFRGGEFLGGTFQGGTFWGVQYHPEYDLHELARLTFCRIDRLVKLGFFRDREAALSYVNLLEALHQDPSRKDIAWLLGVDEDVMSEDIRVAEVRNWIDRLVVPTMARRH